MHTNKIPGLIVIVLLAICSYFVAQLPVVSHAGLSSLVVAIIAGILIGNAWQHPASWTPGIQFAAKRVLRTAIILYGFRVTFQEIASVGIEALLLDIFVVMSTLLVGFYIGKKVLRLDRDLSLLISAGAAICGAAAVLAVEDILKSEPYKATVAVATVVIFGMLSMFLYPALQHWGVFGLTEHQFGVFAGASVHEVAQALVAGTNVSIDAGKTAVIVKMMRVLLLVPVLFVLSQRHQRGQSSEHKKSMRHSVPWFAVGFVLVIGLNSLSIFSATATSYLNQFDMLLLTMAMGAIGMETKWKKIKSVGIKPLYLAMLLFVWLLSSVYFALKFIS
jgi:uncharacterized integral membrane protein (TIGR00698 family)